MLMSRATGPSNSFDISEIKQELKLKFKPRLNKSWNSGNTFSKQELKLKFKPRLNKSWNSGNTFSSFLCMMEEDNLQVMSGKSNSTETTTVGNRFSEKDAKPLPHPNKSIWRAISIFMASFNRGWAR